MIGKLLSTAGVAGVVAVGIGLVAPAAANAATSTAQTTKTIVHPAYSGVVCLGNWGCADFGVDTIYTLGFCNITYVANEDNWVAFEANGRYYPGTGPGTVTYLPAGSCVTEIWIDTPAG